MNKQNLATFQNGQLYVKLIQYCAYYFPVD